MLEDQKMLLHVARPFTKKINETMCTVMPSRCKDGHRCCTLCSPASSPHHLFLQCHHIFNHFHWLVTTSTVCKLFWTHGDEGEKILGVEDVLTFQVVPDGHLKAEEVHLQDWEGRVLFSVCFCVPKLEPEIHHCHLGTDVLLTTAHLPSSCTSLSSSWSWIISLVAKVHDQVSWVSPMGHSHVALIWWTYWTS